MKLPGAKRNVALPLLIPILVLLHTAGLRAGTTVQAWVQRYHGSVTSDDGASALAVDLVGNVYVTGGSSGTNGIFDVATIAYSSAGTPLWTNRYHGPFASFNDQATSVVVDNSNGNVYVTGSVSVLWECGTIAYSSSGAPLWTNLCGCDPQAIGVDTNGNVYVAGTFGGMQANYVTVAYSSAGVPLWTNRYFGPDGTDMVEAMAVDGRGKVYVTGWSAGSEGTVNYATVAYSAAGAALWTNRYSDGQPGANDGALAAAVDNSNGNIYVTGSSDYAGSGSGPDYVTIAYSSAGTPLWTNRYDGPGNNTDGGGDVVAVDSTIGNVYVAGDSIGTNNPYEYVTIAYSSAGAPLWTNFYSAGTNIDTTVSAVAVDSNGNVIVSGDCYSYTDGGYLGYVTIGYSSSGIPLWTNIYQGPGNTGGQVPGPFCLGVGPGGAVYVTGSSGGTDGTDYATVKYVPAPNILFSGINRLPNSTCQLLLTAPTNVAYRLDASADLANWLTLTNFPPLPATSLQYTDTLAPGFPTRFYRTVWNP